MSERVGQREPVSESCEDTFFSNSGGNFMDLSSLSSLSEKRLSWSADVPLKKPTRTGQMAVGRRAVCRATKHSPASAMVDGHEERVSRRKTVWTEDRGKNIPLGAQSSRRGRGRGRGGGQGGSNTPVATIMIHTRNRAVIHSLYRRSPHRPSARHAARASTGAA